MKRIVIIGGGFAGVNLARQLQNVPEFQITLVDRNNYNFFPPLIYQVATGFLDVSNVSYPFRKLFHGSRNIRFKLGELVKLLPDERKVVLSTGELDYDYLVLATGTESNYFGMENIKKVALPLKTVEDALSMRNILLQRTEEATRATDPAEKELLTTIVIAGGGPTGVEVAGMLAEMRANILEKDYPELKGHPVRIYLVDGAPTLLGPMRKESQQYAHQTLRELGVEVILDKQVADYVDDAVVFKDGERIKTKLLLWTAGVTSSVFGGIPKESYGRGRRLVVDAYNQIVGLPRVYAIGDTSLQTTDANFPQGHPQLAQVAIQQGKNLARNLKALVADRPLTPFAYNDKGSMAIIGRAKAVADLTKPKLHVNGFVAWGMWLFVHLLSLIGYRNRVTTLYNWATAYLTKDQALRLIIRGTKTAETVPVAHEQPALS